MNTLKSENHLHDFCRALCANGKLIKRVFLVFAAIALLLPLLLKQSFDISAELMVQSKKLAQADGASASLNQEADKFLPPTLADMETESSILRSPALVRDALGTLRQEGHFHSEDSLDQLTLQVLDDLEVQPIPGSNVISVHYSAAEPALGTLFVNRLLDTYLVKRHALNSSDLPEGFYEQKKTQYQERLGGLEGKRIALLEQSQAANPQEEITFRLNAINQEEQALNQFKDRQLENQRWLDYLQNSLAAARQAKLTEYSFPYTFASTIGNTTGTQAFEDREIRQLGDRLIEQTGQFGQDSDVYRADSIPMKTHYAEISRTRQQFLKVVGNRITERKKDLEVIAGVIAQKTERIAQYKARIHELQGTQSSLRQLDTEIEALHQAFFTYTQRYEESRSRGLLDGGLSNAKVLSRPFEPTEASFPKPLLIIPLGLLTALLLAVAVGYIRDLLDHSFKHAQQIPLQLGLPVLMTINADLPPALPNPHKPGSLPWIRHWASN